MHIFGALRKTNMVVLIPGGIKITGGTIGIGILYILLVNCPIWNVLGVFTMFLPFYKMTDYCLLLLQNKLALGEIFV